MLKKITVDQWLGEGQWGAGARKWAETEGDLGEQKAFWPLNFYRPI